jgi:DNA-binding CsgD family transcriptional regulator
MSKPMSNITEKEKRALEYLVTGDTQANIARKMFMSLSTFNNFLYDMRRRLGCSNTPQMIKKAYDNEWLKINKENFTNDSGVYG